MEHHEIVQHLTHGAVSTTEPARGRTSMPCACFGGTYVAEGVITFGKGALACAWEHMFNTGGRLVIYNNKVARKKNKCIVIYTNGRLRRHYFV